MIGYLTQRGSQVPDGNDWLTAAEHEWLGGRRSAKRVADWRLGRWTAKRAIAAFLERQGRPPPPVIEVLATGDGAPRAFADGRPLALCLSLSHAAGTALCALGPAGIALGCDLERIEPRSGAFVDSYLTDLEATALGELDPTRRDLFANLIWSAKESALKALRQGLRADTRSVEVVVSPGGDGPWRLFEVTCASDGAVFAGRWQRMGDLVATIVSYPPPAGLTDLAGRRPSQARRGSGGGVGVRAEQP